MHNEQESHAGNRESPANAILKLANNLRELSQEALEETTRKLSAYCTQERTIDSDKKDAQAMVIPEFPPYFSELRENLRIVKENLSHILTVVQRSGL